MEHRASFIPSGTLAAVHVSGADVVSVRGKASGREIRIGDTVTPEDGDIVVTTAGYAPVIQGCVTVNGVEV